MEIFWIISISLLFFHGFCGIQSTQCPLQCAKSSENGIFCNITTTACLYGCKLGYAGLNCSVKCPTTCSFDSQGGGDICHATSRKCLFGCKDGYYGSICNNQCSDIDTNCRKCSLMANDSVVCDYCKPNFYRDNGTCKACNYWCAVNFTSPLQSCGENDGYCIFGCRDGNYGPRCDQSCTNACKDVCNRDTGTGNIDIIVIVFLGIGWFWSLVLTVVLIVIAIRRVYCDKRSANLSQREEAGTKDRLQHIYMTLEEESSFSKSPEMYATLTKGKVCKHGNSVAEESQLENRTRDNETAPQVGNLYAVAKLEAEYQNLNIKEGNTSLFGKELTYLNLETNDE